MSIGQGGQAKYKFFWYCTKCQETKPIGQLRCDECGQPVRRGPRARKQKEHFKTVHRY